MIDLNDYYSGGYFLIRADKPDWNELNTDLLPPKLISLSSHMCPKLCVYWGGTPGDKNAALDFGIPESKLDEFLAWCAGEYHTDLDVFSMFHSTEAAHRFIDRFLPDHENLYLIGAGLHHDLEAANWRAVSDVEPEGVEKRIEQHLSMETGGVVLGFDIVGYSHHEFDCSWLCTYVHRYIYEQFGIRPNQYGLIDTFKETKTILAWMEDEDNKMKVEPILFDFWLLVAYPLEPNQGIEPL